jgi:hypothetical protein
MWNYKASMVMPGAPSHIQKAHLPQQIIGNLNDRVTRSSRSAHLSYFTNTLFVALFEPRDVGHALSDLSWFNVMHEELENFERNHVWTLVQPPRDVNVIGTKGFKLYQMDVKSAFLNGVIQGEVFVRQPPSFENPKYPNRVYMLLEALYGLKQALRAWCARLKTFLLEHRYVMGSVDKTLFTLNHGIDFLLVQIYVDDIIFGGSSHTLVSRFQEMMENEFQMPKFREPQISQQSVHSFRGFVWA